MMLTFSEFPYNRPDIDELRASYTKLTKRITDAASAGEQSMVIRDWMRLRAKVQTAGALAGTHYNQDTTSEASKAEKAFFDENGAAIHELYVDMCRKLLNSTFRAELIEQWGTHLFDLFECEVASFDQVISELVVEECKLETRYIALMAKPIEFRGETLNLSRLGKFAVDADRRTRKEAKEATWEFFDANQEEFDDLFDQLTRLRHQQGTRLGYDTYKQLAYKQMGRTQWGENEAARFRAQVAEHVVPLSNELREQQRRRLGLDKMLFYDQGVMDPEGNPAPQGDDDWVIAQAQNMYRKMGDLGPFFDMMIDRELLDLKTRDGKSGGGYCTKFSDYAVPFVFANFNSTENDVRVLCHEIGHAFQGYNSFHFPALEYHFPTAEACEIHSMSLEYLTWPYMDGFFGDEADRFRRNHIDAAMRFLPYACAVDEFQHRIYEAPDAKPSERHGIWQEMEQKYLPHLDYYGMVHVSKGGFWQVQRHIYLWPFYYLDYALASTAALEFWIRSRADGDRALADYVAMCKLGGSQPYLSLLDSIGLASPFEEGTVMSVVNEVRAWMEENA